MKSNVCKIEKGTQDLEAILRESEKFAAYNELSHKQSLQLRLLCEEIDGLLPNVVEDFEGDIWFESEDGVCKVCISIELEKITADKRDNLLELSSKKGNAAAVGITGKIRSVAETLILTFINKESLNDFAMSANAYHLSNGYSECVDHSYLWSLYQYRNNLEQKHTEAWDELEKSVIASVADDVIVGVKGNKAEIVIVKKFA